MTIVLFFFPFAFKWHVIAVFFFIYILVGVIAVYLTILFNDTKLVLLDNHLKQWLNLSSIIIMLLQVALSLHVHVVPYSPRPLLIKKKKKGKEVPTNYGDSCSVICPS